MKPDNPTLIRSIYNSLPNFWKKYMQIKIEITGTLEQNDGEIVQYLTIKFRERKNNEPAQEIHN